MRVIELAFFFILATVLGTVGFRFYQSPDGKSLWDFLNSKQASQPWQKEFMKEVKIPEWKWGEGSPFLPKGWVPGDKFESPWKGIIWKPEGEFFPAKSSTKNNPAFTQQMKDHNQRMQQHRERMRAHYDRMNSQRASWGGRHSPPTSGPRLNQNPFAH